MDKVKTIWNSKAKFREVIEIDGSLKEELKNYNNDELAQLREQQREKYGIQKEKQSSKAEDKTR